MSSAWFDGAPDRRGTGSLKWQLYEGRDIIPLWVADMDFQPPPVIRQRLADWAVSGTAGYSVATRSLKACLVTAMEERYEWQIEPSWIVWLPGLVPALNIVTRISGSVGDGVISNTPIYPPFLTAPGNADRRLMDSPLRCADGDWTLDLGAIPMDKSIKTYLFCNPHNPTGRVFRREELEQVAAFCLAHDLVLCSDEIHCDLILDEGKCHLPIASLSTEMADRTITLMAPSKTYNVPGLVCSFAVIPKTSLRRQFVRSGRGLLAEVSTPGFIACEAAYSACEEWRQELLGYLRRNRDLVKEAVGQMPGVRYLPGEATYLAWLDCRHGDLEHPHAFFERAGVGLSDGRQFGAPGCVRLNFGCRRSLLTEGLARMVRAVAQG